MEHPVTFNIPVEQAESQRTNAKGSDIAEIREMFREMNQRYMVYKPSATYLTLKRVMDVAISMTFIILVMSWLFPHCGPAYKANL